MRKEAVERMVKALEDIRAGRMVILVDDEDRENEGDLVMAADLVTPDAVNFMARYARGLICLPMTEERLARLKIPMMVDDNQCSRKTAFTVSIEAREGVTTGISAADRCHTIRVAVARDADPRDIVSPGHIFPLAARPGGVLQRTGHTEGAVDMARLAGLQPAGVICEIMKDDGTMARYPDLVEFAKEHDLRIVTIADLIEYRLAHERIVERVREVELTLESGKSWRAIVYRVGTDARRFLALVHGEVDKTPTLVRVHKGNVVGDLVRVLGSNRLGVHEAIARIEDESRGVVLLLPGDNLLEEELAQHLGEQVSRETPERGAVLREYGLGAQVLADLGLGEIRVLTNQPRRLPSLDGYGLKVVEQLTLGDLDSRTSVVSDETGHHTTH